MMVGIIGGLLCGGLVAGALLGLVPGAMLLGLGAVVGCAAATKERRAEKQAESWRNNYPPYGY